jgi:hypothetical protein
MPEASAVQEDAFGRTLYGAVMDVQFGIHFNAMNEQVFARFDRLLTFVNLAGGTVVAANLLKSMPEALNIGAGIAIAVCSLIQALWNPASRAGEHKLTKCEFYSLDSDVRTLSIEEAYKRINELRSHAPGGIGLLLQPAFNRTLQAAGHVETVSIGFFAWTIALFA